MESNGNSATASTYTAYDGLSNHPYADFIGGSSTPTTRFIWADTGAVDLLLARLDGASGVAWYLTDEEGSVEEIVDPSGNVLDRLNYGPFGEHISETNPSLGDRFKYASGAYDPNTGLIQFGLRYYDPYSGRWISQDPGGYAMGDSNLYRYVGNSPTSAVDPTGLYGERPGDQPEDKFLPSSGPLGGFLNNGVQSGSETGVLFANQVIPGYIPQAPSHVSFDPQDSVPISPIDYVDRFFAGLGDAVTNGLTTRARTALYADIAELNHRGMMFDLGRGGGNTVATGLAMANPCDMARLATGLRTLNVLEGASNLCNAKDSLGKEDYWSAGLQTLAAFGNFLQAFGPCFVAGTPLRTPDGHKPIEDFRKRDLILSRSEDDPSAPLVVREVEEVFLSAAFLRVMRASGHEIRTTAQHPFWLKDKGWTSAGQLRVGDQVAGISDQWLTVESVSDTEEYVPVYNLRIAEDNTYFVGELAWGFAVWAHNNNCGPDAGEAPNRTKIGKFLEGDDVAEAGAHAKEVGKVTGVVDRAGKDARRAENMKGHPLVPGKDRDEFPPAVIKPDDPSKVSVKPVDPSHNRRSGRRLRDELPPDGTPVEIDP